MGLGRTLAAALFVIALLAVSIVVYSKKDDGIQFSSSNKQQKQKPQRLADDPTYGQELRTLTAKLKNTEEAMKVKERERSQKSMELQEKISQLSSKLNAKNSNNNGEIKKITALIEDLKNDKSEVVKENAELKDQIASIAEDFKSLKEQQNKSVERYEKLLNEKDESKSNAGIKLEELMKQNIDSARQVTGVNDEVFPSQSKVMRSHKPYAPEGVEAPKGGNSYTNLGGLLGGLTGEPTKISNDPFSANTQVSSNREKVVQLTRFPVYTLPVTTMLTDSTLLTPLIGRVPFKGNVNDPFKFQIELGPENLAANGHKIPGVSKALVSGIATGNREQSCTRGVVTAMTFIFEDGRISTAGSKGGSNNTGLGYLADQHGKPCIFGEYINNAGDYLKGRSVAAFLEGLAGAYGQAQITRESKDGGISSYISGNTYEFAASQGISRTAEEVADYVRDRAMDAFDVVYVPQATKVQIIIEKQINIDYDLSARKINYLNNNEEISYD